MTAGRPQPNAVEDVPGGEGKVKLHVSKAAPNTILATRTPEYCRSYRIAHRSTVRPILLQRTDDGGVLQSIEFMRADLLIFVIIGP